MNDSEILALYDHDERRQIEYPGMRREDLGRVVRQVDLHGGQGFVLYSQLDEASAGDAIEQQIAFYEGIGQDFEWKVFDHDCPADLRQRLLKRGFVLDDDDEEALLILPLAETPARLLEPVTHDIRRVADPDAMMRILAVQAEVWNEDYWF